MKTILLILITILVSIGGDRLEANFPSLSIGAALIDNLTHASIGALCWLIVVIQNNAFSFKEVLLCGIFSSLIDVDHFIEMQTVNIQDIKNLDHRPFLHCTTAGLFVAAEIVIVGYWLKSTKILHLGLIIFVAVFTHHTRDATRRGYWMYPFGETRPIPYLSYILITATLPLVIYLPKLHPEYSKLSDGSSIV